MSAHSTRTAGTGFAFIAFVTLAGCADSSIAIVKGTVTVDGQPIAKGKIAFYPADGKSQPAGGDVTDGAYHVEVPVGPMKVQISMPKEAGRKKLYNTPDSPSYPVYNEGLPKKYNVETQLLLDVKPGGIEKDWDLASK